MNCAPTQFPFGIGSFLQDITTCCNWKDSKVRNSKPYSGKHQSRNELKLERRFVTWYPWVNRYRQVRVNGSKLSAAQILRNCVLETKFCSAMGIRSLEKLSQALF